MSEGNPMAYMLCTETVRHCTAKSAEIWHYREALSAATERAERAEAELALRKDYADQVRAQSATIIRLGQEIEVADKARDEARELAVWAVRHCAYEITGGLDHTRGPIKGGMTDAGILAALRKAKEESGGELAP